MEQKIPLCFGAEIPSLALIQVGVPVEDVDG